MKRFIIYFFSVIALSLSTHSRAELGDYSAWRTFLHLFNPPKPDNPVTAADENAEMYPLISNPSNFDDGWSPGAYLAWQTIQLSPSTGAICGDGSPYKFFVNRVANTSNTVFYMEGGGACWDYASCTGATGIRGARNANGIPNDYMSILNPMSSLASPFIFRLNPLGRTKVQAWNMVYIPYCTGDIYTGDGIAVYEDPSGENEDLVWHHNGLKNMRAVMAWIKDNLQSPGQMLVTGCSAGGTGSLTNYASFKNDIDAQKSFLLNDSGPIYDTPENGLEEDFPSKRLHTRIREAWSLDRDLGPLTYLEDQMPAFNRSNMGSITGGLANAFPSDRLGHTHFWRDLNFSSYSYENFYDDIFDETDDDIKEERILARWQVDTNNYIENLSQYDNFGYYFPYFRNVNESHCTTIVDFKNGDIQEQGLEISDFISSVLEGNGSVLEASETDTEADLNKPFNPLYYIIDNL